MKKIHNLLKFTFLIGTILLVSQCKKVEVPVSDPHLVKLAGSADLGSYLTDNTGHALYFFSLDAKGSNTCTGGCTTYWPIFNVSGLTQAQLGTGLDLADFKTISTAGGNQLTYKGWPLYYYAPGGNRELAGETAGDSVGGVWFVAKPDYTIMLAKGQLVGADGKNYIISDAGVFEAGNGITAYFTDFAGRTLYSFDRDSANVNRFTKPDFSNDPLWPIYQTDQVVVPSSVDKNLFGSITVYGKKQLTYRGWPMFYYGADLDATGNFRGNTKGVSVPNPGVWPVFNQNTPDAPRK